MDPLSLAASVAGLLALAGTVVSAGYKLSSKMSKNADDLTALINEIAGFSGILLGVKAYLESKPPAFVDLDILSKMLEDSRNTLNEIAELVDKLSSANRLMMIVKGEERETRLEKLLRRVGQYKLFFILCFHFQHGSQSETIHRKMTEIIDDLEAFGQNQKKIEQAVGKLVDGEQLRRVEKILQWLGPVTDTEHDDLCKQRDSASAEWILTRREFGSWLSSAGSSFFWLNGIQGSGKSIIISKIIEVIQETSLEPDGSALAYHYCRFSHPSSISPSRLVGSFISQLLKQSADSGAHMALVNELYEKHQRRSTLPSFEDLQEIFLSLLQCFARIFIVIDGLDEMPDRWSILDFLESLSQRDGDCKILVASRAEMDLENAFSFYCTVTITPGDIVPDIERFVRKQLSRRRFRGSELEAIVRELVARADGMFLWVVCQVDHLFHVRTAITPRLLQALPRNLERTYEQTFLKLGEDDRILAKRVLQFIMFSSAPLDLAELVEGIAVTSSTRCLEDVKCKKLDKQKDVFELCGSLIRESLSTGKIELAHYSVYLFLKSPRLEGNRRNDLYLDEAKGNPQLLLACARYLCMEDVCATGLPEEVEEALDEDDDDDTYVNPEVFANTPFLEHAVTNWPVYLSRITEAQLRKLWGSVLLPFFQQDRGHFDFWAKMARYVHGHYKYTRKMTPLHATALHGLSDLAHLLMNDPSLRAASWQPKRPTAGFRTPLHIAIENGQDKMLDTFLIPCYSQSTDEKGRTPLHIALESANELAVIQLVSAGADANLCGKDGRTPIFIAIENSWEGLVPLLSKMANPAVTMPDGRGLLHLAAQTGSTVWTSSLLDLHEHLLDSVDQRGWPPLLYAVDRSHAGIVKMLLSKGACTGIQDKNGWTPLHAAMRHKHLECGTLLLTSSNPRWPLMQVETGTGSACQQNHQSRQERAEMDRKYGRAHRRNNTGGTAAGSSIQTPGNTDNSLFPSHSQPLTVPSPLFVAVSNSFAPGVEMLLRHAQAYGHRGIGLLEEDGACLKKALSLPDTGILELLLPFSTVSNVLEILPEAAEREDEEVRSVLRQKLDSKFVHMNLLPRVVSNSKTNMDIAHFLLDLWPPPNSSLPQNILHVVAQRVTAEGPRLATRLIEGGASRFHIDDIGRTALQAAIYWNNWDVAHVFIMNGMADIDMVPNALHDLVENARFQGNNDEHKVLQVAALLLEKGIDVGSVDQAGRSICHQAAARDDTVLLKWALENNAYPFAEDSRGETAVSVAVAFECTENLELLLNSIMQMFPEDLVRILASSGVRGSPLIMATNKCDIGILTKLIEADLTITLLSGNHCPAHQSRRLINFTNALCNAIRRNFDHGVSLLISAMTDVSGLNSSGETPLHVAVRNANDNIVLMLLEHGAQVNVQQADTGETPYGIAAAAGMKSIMTVLSEHGAEYQARDIIAAAKNGNKALLEGVLATYPDDLEGQKEALFIARNNRCKEIENALLANAASHSQPLRLDGIPQDAYGDTALHQAVRDNDSDQVQFLAGAGDRVFLDAKDIGGDSALMLAIRICHWSSAETLASAGADIEEALETAISEQCNLWIDKLEDLRTRYPNNRRLSK